MGLPKYIVNKLMDPDEEYVSLDNCGLTEAGIKELVVLLQKNPKVVRLSMQSNNLSSQSLKAFVGLPPTIEFINLSRNNLDDDAADILLDVFKSISALDLSYNALTNTSARKFAFSASQLQLKLVGNPIDEAHYNLILCRLHTNRQSSSITEPLLPPPQLDTIKLNMASIQAVCQSLEPQQQLEVLEYLEKEIRGWRDLAQPQISNLRTTKFF